MIAMANTDGSMPAILRRKDYQAWLRGTPVAAKATLHPYIKSGMHAYPASPRINSTAPDDPALIRPVEIGIVAGNQTAITAAALRHLLDGRSVCHVTSEFVLLRVVRGPLSRH